MLDRRTLLVASAGTIVGASAGIPSALAAARPAGAQTLAGGLNLGESPLIASDGSVLLCEVRGGTILRVTRDGARSTIVTLPGRPAGIAAGPDGALYVADIGRPAKDGNPAIKGAVLRIDPRTRAATPVVTEGEGGPLIAPDDLVFDEHGGFYISDAGRFDPAAPTQDRTGVYYFDGKAARRITDRMLSVNGLDLSLDGKRLYWTEYRTGRLYSRDVASPGVLKPPASPRGDCLYSHPVPLMNYDSLRVDGTGCVTIAAHSGTSPGHSALVSFDGDGKLIDMRALEDEMVTSVAFNPTRGEALVTSGERLSILPWPRLGRKPRYTLDPAFCDSFREDDSFDSRGGQFPLT